MTMHTPNPLLASTGLPCLTKSRAEHVGPAIDQLIAHASAALETVTAPDFPADWNAIGHHVATPPPKPWAVPGAPSATSSSVADTPELRAAYNAALPAITEFWTRLGADERLYAKYKAIDRANPQLPSSAKPMPTPCAALSCPVPSCKALPKSALPRFRSAAPTLAQKFSENTLDATDRWAYYATAEEMEGVPADVQQAARAAAQAEGQDGFKLTLKIPCYLPVMQFATHSSLREKLYRAYVTRASDQAEGDGQQYDNRRHHRRDPGPAPRGSAAAGLRQFWRSLSGAQDGQFPAQKSSTFLRDLAQRARPYAEKDVARPAPICQRTPGPDRSPALGLDLHRRKAQGSALRLQ